MTFLSACVRASLLAATAIVAVAPLAPAQAQQRSRRFDIPAQPAANALNEWARQAGAQIVFPYDAVRNRRTPAVRGSLTPREALTRLTAPLGLEIASEANGIVTLRGGNAPPGESEAGGAAADSGSADAGQVGVAEILVIGRRTLNVDVARTENDPQPYMVFSRTEIERSGATTVEEFFRNHVPADTAGLTAARNVDGNASRINLRGLGTDQTLILVDGRRIPGWNQTGQPQQPDINGIPVAAIERIEVLPTTASGIYGGSATGGVVNIVLRRDYRGVEARLTYADTLDWRAPSGRVDISLGAPLGRNTSFMLFGSYAAADPLRVGDRDFTARGRQRLLAANPARLFGVISPPLGATTNIRAESGNLVLKPQYGGASLGSNVTFIPTGYSGVGSDNGAALIANAGRYNLDLADTAQSGGAGRNLLSTPEIWSIDATVRHRFGARFEVFVEASASNNDSSVLFNGTAGSFRLLASAPGNPFNQNIRVTTPAFGADIEAEFESSTRRLLGGLIFTISDSWRAELDYSKSWTRAGASLTGAAGLLNAAGTAAINSGALDIFRDTRAYPVDFGPYLPALASVEPVESSLENFTLRASGTLPVRLPGGRPATTLLVEHRNEFFGDAYVLSPPTRTLYPSRSQNVDSAYAELRLPIAAAQNEIPLLEELELQLALRADFYSVEGATAFVNPDASPPVPIVRVANKDSSVNPTIALRWSPARGVVLRGSYGTGYLPPSVNQLVPGAPTFIPSSSAVFLGLTDPKRGGEVLGLRNDLTFATGGNPDLRPERSQSWSAGVILTPAFLPGLRFSIDWTSIRKRDNIAAAFSFRQADLANENLIPGLVTRAAPPAGDPFGVGPITSLNSGLFNIARVDVQAWDFNLDYQRDIGPGRLTVAATATHLDQLTRQTVPNAPIERQDGTIGGVDWRGSASASWEQGPATIGVAARYIGSYWLNSARTIDVNQGEAKVERQIYFDLFGRYRFGQLRLAGRQAEFVLQAGINNVLDAAPPLDLSGNINAGVSRLGDPRRANYYLTLTTRF